MGKKHPTWRKAFECARAMKPCPIIAMFNFFLWVILIGSLCPQHCASRSKHHRSIGCGAQSTANAPIYPSRGSRLNKLHREIAFGSVLTSCNIAGASGSIETENSDKGNDSPSPLALMNASLRVQQAKKARANWFFDSADSARYSFAEKNRSARSRYSTSSLIFSTSTP